MYAVIETGGKQYRVAPGEVFQVEKLEGDKGASVKFEKVLFVANPGEEKTEAWLGKPYVDKAAVNAEVVAQGRGKKILTIKYRRRKGYRKTQGHRQEYTQLIVTGVDNGAGTKVDLSAEDKAAQLKKFRTQLRPKGQAFTPKTLGSRKRLKDAAEAARLPKAETKSKKAAPQKAAAESK